MPTKEKSANGAIILNIKMYVNNDNMGGGSPAKGWRDSVNKDIVICNICSYMDKNMRVDTDDLDTMSFKNFDASAILCK